MRWVNYDSVLAQLRGAGLEVDALEVNTLKRQRCREINGDKEKRCWYSLYDIELTRHDGSRHSYIVGAYGIFRGAEKLKFKVELSKGALDITREQRQAMEARYKDTLARVKAQRQAEIQRAADAAQNAWAHFVPDGESGYLEKKRVQAHGLRYSAKANGTVAVPMLDAAGRIWGLQIIRTRRGALQKEYWPKGCEVQGHFHLLGAPQAGGVLLLAEGYATGASLHEAAQLPTAVAFDAGNLIHVALALRKAYPGLRILVCADDDHVQKCLECRAVTKVAVAECQHCGNPHGQKNPGVEAAKATAHAVDGKVLVPAWPFDRGLEKITDFNDLAVHPEGGPHLVRAQVWAAVTEAGWAKPKVGTPPPAKPTGGAGDNSGRSSAVSILPIDDAVARFMPIDDGTGKVLFDEWTKKLVLREQMLSLLPAGIRWDDVKRHPTWKERGSFYLDEVGFDPAGDDPATKLNTWSGWPTTPAAGSCKKTLDLLRYLCSGETNAEELYQWVLRWVAYPIQHPGAKMRTALVVHGPQGTGKSLFFESIARIYGEYGLVINQGAIEDKFNSDWSSRKLYVVADEIVARQDMYHIKNQLKTFITGDWIRVNPKNLPAYRERNHMNIVFLSNERQPVVLESDDRRHGVMWTPPTLAKAVYDDVIAELDSGGLAALHQHLLDLDLGDFGPHTKPPMTGSKADLQNLGRSSVERFVHEWQQLEVVSPKDGQPIPFCPCLGSQLYAVYRHWCSTTGERDLGDKRLIGHVKKMHGWTAGQSEPTWRSWADRTTTNRKMVVPSAEAMSQARENGSDDKQERLHPDAHATKKDWLTTCFFAFGVAGGFAE